MKQYLENRKNEESPSILKGDLDNDMVTLEKSFMEDLYGDVLDIGCGYLYRYD